MSTQASLVGATAVAVGKQNKTSTPGQAAVNSKTAEWRKNSWRKKLDLAVIDKTTGLVSKGQDWLTARQSLADMKAAGTVPDAQAYSSAAALCHRHGTLAEAQTLLQEMSDAGHSSDLAMCLLQLKVASRQFMDGGIGSLDDVITAFQAIEQSGFEPTELSYDRVIAATAKAKDEEKCMQYLHAAMKKFSRTVDAATFAHAIVLLGSADKATEACALIDEIYKRKLAPTVLAVNCALQSCARNQQLEIALPLLDKAMTHIKLQSLSHTTVLVLIQACADDGLTVAVTKLVRAFINTHLSAALLAQLLLKVQCSLAFRQTTYLVSTVLRLPTHKMHIMR
eukprot:1591-Heterococcus_DN1.PRE.4